MLSSCVRYRCSSYGYSQRDKVGMGFVWLNGGLNGGVASDLVATRGVACFDSKIGIVCNFYFFVYLYTFCNLKTRIADF